MPRDGERDDGALKKSNKSAVMSQGGILQGRTPGSGADYILQDTSSLGKAF